MKIAYRSFVLACLAFSFISAAQYRPSGSEENQVYLKMAIRFFENIYPAMSNKEFYEDVEYIHARYFLDSANLRQMYLYENYGWTKCIEIIVVMKKESVVCHAPGGSHYFFYLGNGRIPGIRIAKGLKDCRAETDTFMKINGLKSTLPWL